MPQPYLCLFNPLSLSPSELIPRVERVLATAGFTFDGTARKFERGRDGSLYYQLETVNSAHWTEAAAKAIAERWAGVAFECRFRGYDVTVGVLQDKSGTTLTMDHDSVLFYELEKDEELRQQWLGGILELVEQLSATVCVFRKGGLKESVDPSVVIAGVRAGTMKTERNPILVVVRDSLFPYAEAAALHLERVKVFSVATGYTVVSALFRNRPAS